MYCELVSLNMPYLETECTLGVLLTRQLDLLGLGEDVMWWKGFQAAHGIFDGFVKLAAQTNQVLRGWATGEMGGAQRTTGVNTGRTRYKGSMHNGTKDQSHTNCKAGKHPSCLITFLIFFSFKIWS